MSMDDFETCLVSEYNADAEAVSFIVQIYRLGGQEALQAIMDNWAKILTASGIIAAIAKFGGQSTVVKLLSPVFGSLAGGVIDVLATMLVGLALGAVLLAVGAGIACAPRVSQ